jgi:hypothetical protein
MLLRPLRAWPAVLLLLVLSLLAQRGGAFVPVARVGTRGASVRWTEYGRTALSAETGSSASSRLGSEPSPFDQPPTERHDNMADRLWIWLFTRQIAKVGV